MKTIETSSRLRLIDRLMIRNCMIEQAEIFTGQFDALVSSGLQILTICNDGYYMGRSGQAAYTLTYSYRIPSVQLVGGLRGIHENLIEPEQLFIQKILSEVPNIAIILTSPEVDLFRGFIDGLHPQSIKIFPDLTSIGVFYTQKLKQSAYFAKG